jgi:ABC-type hemin transport system ATPase subunit
MTETRPSWSRRRRRLLAGLALGGAAGGLGAVVLPAGAGLTAAYLGALCGFLLVAAAVVFVAVPGPDTLGTLVRTTPLAGAVCVVAVLLALSTEGQPLRWLWWLTAAVGAVWVAAAVWLTRRG